MLCLLLLGYFSCLSYQYNFLTGGIASALAWTFFVLCTPIADAGFLLDFPIRLLFGIRMLISELAVWVLAIAINIISLLYFSEYYQTTELNKLLHAILTIPFPCWGVILLSGCGTFLSIQFADELMDVLHHGVRELFHRNSFKHEIVVLVFFIFFIGLYGNCIVGIAKRLLNAQPGTGNSDQA